MTKTKWIIVVLCLFTIGGLGYYFSTLKPEKEKIYIGYQGLARVNSLLAAEDMFKKLGHTYKSFSRYNHKLIQEEYIDVIICPISALPKSSEKIQNLQLWLRSGGHLITGISERSKINSSAMSNDLKKLLYIEEISPLEKTSTQFVNMNGIVNDLQQKVNFEIQHQVVPS